MKILLVHNDYARHSGEETVVETMATLLQNRGHKVAFYRRSSCEKRERLSGQVAGFFQGIYSPSGIRGMREVILREKPDVINVHNLYPFISPAALSECHKANIPVVMTVHNYRLICPTGLFMRNGAPCEKCLQQGGEWSCIRHNCEGTLPRSIGYALRGAYARWNEIFHQYVDRFACLSEFQRQKLITAGFDAAKIRIIPNTIDIPDSLTSTNGEYVAYCSTLDYLDVANWDVSNVTNVSGMFKACESLDPLDLNNWNISRIRYYEGFMDNGSMINGAYWTYFFQNR